MVTHRFRETLRLALFILETFPRLSETEALTYSAMFVKEILENELECETPSVDP